MKVYIAQLKCPANHCVMALAEEYGDAEKALALDARLRAVFAQLVDEKLLNYECAICHSKDLNVHIAATRFRTMAEARPALKQVEEAQAETARFLRSLKN